MVDYSDQAVYKINKFITDKLQSSSIIPAQAKYITQISSSNTNLSLSFITPAQQSAELTTAYDSASISPTEDGFFDLPFANYTVTHKYLPDQPYMNCGQVTYIIYTHDIQKLMEIGSYIVDLCKREDYSAADLNQHLVPDATNPFSFTNLSVLSAGGPMQAESEGGRHGFMVVISFDYIYDSALIGDANNTSFSGGQAMWS